MGIRDSSIVFGFLRVWLELNLNFEIFDLKRDKIVNENLIYSMINVFLFFAFIPINSILITKHLQLPLKMLPKLLLILLRQPLILLIIQTQILLKPFLRMIILRQYTSRWPWIQNTHYRFIIKIWRLSRRYIIPIYRTRKTIIFLRFPVDVK